MPAKQTKEEFIEKANKAHNNFYSYSKVVYINSSNKVIITCPLHGDFEQRANDHLKPAGCGKCKGLKISNSKRSNINIFIEKAIIKYGGKYKYDNTIYKNSFTKVIITCPIHGDFEQLPSSHLRGVGCRFCGNEVRNSKNRNTTEDFLKNSLEVHGNRYDYSRVKYISSRDKVDIKCSVHGIFRQAPVNHVQGQGCQKCGEESNFGRSNYIKKVNGRECTYYVIKCFNKEEEFYKIGITVKSVKERYSGSKSMPYSYTIISETKGDADTIWALELNKKRELKDFNYQPNINFYGSKTECFTKYNLKL